MKHHLVIVAGGVGKANMAVSLFVRFVRFVRFIRFVRFVEFGLCVLQ